MKTGTALLWLLILAYSTQAQTFTLKSRELGGQATSKQMLNGFGCTGNNLSPALFWENMPTGTKSFAITLHDANAPTGSGWWHWVVFDIPAAINQIAEDAGNPLKNLMPAPAIQSITDFGQMGYGGPCPPEGHGFHQYTLTLYALDTEKLGLDKNANPALVGFYLNQHTIQKTSLVFYLKR